MNTFIINSNRKLKRRQLVGEGGEFCVDCVECEITVVYPGVGVQKAIGNMEKSGMEVEIWELLYVLPK